jgi:RHH-type proline utilization regulon transcriptional repressor/proline dehydrogenase/delta 1-pyrroline-5-carboxylate dehydrogenase
MAGDRARRFEFQRLHGMGEALHEIVRKKHGTRCRIYAPVGAHRDLLAYLVRRLLENGANSAPSSTRSSTRHPARGRRRRPGRAGAGQRAHPEPRSACRGRDLFRRSAQLQGLRPARPRRWRLIEARAPFAEHALDRAPDPGRRRRPGTDPGVRTPPTRDIVGHRARGHPDVETRSTRRSRGQWPATAAARAGAAPRRRPLRGAHGRALRARCARGRQDAARRVAELREAVDFLRYYAGGRALEAEEPGPRAASSPASAPGTSRWPSSPARSPPRWPRATRCWRNRPSRRPLIATCAVGAAARGRRAATRCNCCPATARRSARR